MPLEDIVSLSITREARPLERAGFGTVLFLAMHRAWDDRIKYYTKLSGLTDDGFGTRDDVYLAVRSHFAQNPKPQRIAIGRLETDDAVIVKVDDVENSTRYTVFIDGCGFTYISDATATTTEIEAALLTILNSGYTITTKSASNDTITIAGNYVASFPAGATFSISGSTSNDGDYTVVEAVLTSGNTVIEVEEDVASEGGSQGVILPSTLVTATNPVAGDGEITVSPTTPATFVQMKTSTNMHMEFNVNETMGAALTAIEAEDSTGWYTVCLAHNFGAGLASPAGDDLDAIQKDLADEIETRRKLFIAASPDANTVDVTQASDDETTGTLARYVQGRGYARTAVLYSTQADNGFDEANDYDEPDPYADLAWAGACLTWDAGRETWAHKSLTGVLADELTETQRSNALAKNANVYVPLTSSRSITEFGTVGDGEFIDIIRLSDAIYSEVITNVAEALVNSVSPLAKLPYTDAGIAVIEAAIKNALDKFTGPTLGIASYTVTVPAAEDVSDTDKGNRTLTGVEFEATVTGAVHTTTITGSVTV